ncbi:glycoside hydrolase family 108 protein [Rhodospirillum sp. A1_3_36]|uniref:glycoside hydrolase family 108 protein n=1 Tax=Rhodospirillum sp. A1_3_36 TaxID=3391666 RepID=UPI0039A594E2
MNNPVNSLSPDRVWALARAEVLAHEGDFVNHPADPGGATNHGVSLRFLRSLGLELGDVDGDGDIDVDDIKALTSDDAAELFHLKFWGPCGCDKIAEISPILAIKLFDVAVNVGVRQAVKLLQRATVPLGVGVVDDGIVGPQTLSAIRALRGHLVSELCLQQRRFYLALIKKNPALKAFEAGWLARARWIPSI